MGKSHLARLDGSAGGLVRLGKASNGKGRDVAIDASQVLDLPDRSSCPGLDYGGFDTKHLRETCSPNHGARKLASYRYRAGIAASGDWECSDHVVLQQVSGSPRSSSGKVHSPFALIRTYAMVHIPATIAFMAYSYRYFQPAVFQSTRRTLVICNCLAFIIFSLWPCMPPRLLPFDEFGYVDTLHAGKAASIWTTNKVGDGASPYDRPRTKAKRDLAVPESARRVPVTPLWLLIRHVSILKSGPATKLTLDLIAECPF